LLGAGARILAKSASGAEAVLAKSRAPSPLLHIASSSPPTTATDLTCLIRPSASATSPARPQIPRLTSCGLETDLDEIPYQGGLMEFVPGNAYIPLGLAPIDVAELYPAHTHLRG